MRTHTRLSRFALIPALVLGLALFAACSKPKQPPMPVGSLKLGVAPFTQPKAPQDMLAGYLPEATPEVEQKVLGELDGLLAQTLLAKTNHSYTSADAAGACRKTVAGQKNAPQAALRTWSAVGRCMDVDLLIVPQVYEWRERDGGEYGVAVPAKVIMDIFVLDVKNESLISRSRYDETQSALTDNLLEAGKFVNRGGKWVTAKALAEEGMDKAIKELGL